MLLPVRASQPPWPLLRLPWAQTSAVDRIEVVSVGALPKIGWRSPCGIRNLPTVTRPQLPCRPTKVSRLAMPELELLPESQLTFDSSWKIAFNPPPRLSVPRMPKREELLLRRSTVGFLVLRLSSALPFAQLVMMLLPGTEPETVPLLPCAVGEAQVWPFTHSRSTLARP